MLKTKQIPLIDLKAQYQQIQDEVEPKVLEVLRSGGYVLGPKVENFENNAANFLGLKHAVGCANGSDALYIALLALDIKAGDEVLTTPFTYVATAESITQAGATPVFVDIDPTTFNIDAKKLEEKISSKTKAIILVHLYGRCADMNSIMAVARKHKLKVIEDAAQAFGSSCQFEGKEIKAGGIGDIGTFSFYPTKNLSCAGDGGMMTTNSTEINERLRKIRAHGSSRRYYHDELGVNSRLDALQAEILNIKLQHIQRWNNARRANAALYSKLLADCHALVCPQDTDGHIYHQYTIRVLNNQSKISRDELKTKLAESNISSEVYYPLSMHEQNIYKELGYQASDLPESVKATQEVLSLPVYPELEASDIEYICSKIKEFVL